MSDLVSITQLSVEAQRFAYRDRLVVDNVSFTARAGEQLAIVGPNGCGKSTLLRLLVGELHGSGRIALDDQDVRRIGRIGMARRIAMVPQMAGAGASAGSGGGMGYTVREVVLMARYAAHVQRASGLGRVAVMAFETARDVQLAAEAMWAADVHHLVDRPVDTLSGGERQRVAIARAVAQETPILLLDEPTSSLDLYHQLELLEQLRTLAAAGRMVIMVTHDLNLAREHASRVLVMDQGRIVADGKPADILIPAVLQDVYRVRIRISTDGTLHFERLPPSVG